MECPFELPVKKIPDSKEFEGLWVVVDKAGMIIGFPLKDIEADYIVQAINCHKKLANALNTYGNHLLKCKYLQGLKGQTIENCDCGFEQALKEAEKQ